MSLQHIIEERVRNAYAAGHNDARKGRWGRMDEVAKTETERILKAVESKVRITYVNEAYDQPWCPNQYQVTVWWEDDTDPMVTGHIFGGDASDNRDEAYRTAFQHGLEYTLRRHATPRQRPAGRPTTGG